MKYLGVDPGKKGAWAIIDERGKAYAEIWSDDGFAEQMRLLSKEPERVRCVVEHVGAMPKQGVSSTFAFGTEFGIIQGILIALNIPYELVRPQRWKKAFGVTSDKNTSIAVCRRLFPGVSLRPGERSQKDSDGMAEALLIAEYCKRLNNA